jgi:hypothetical protein
MKLLNAGPLQMGYENGFLRRIGYGDAEILRMIYFALRDHNWNTLSSRIENEVMRVNAADFEITYDCFHSDSGVDVMEWKGNIKGHANGSIVFEIRGKTLETFRRNRAGFCILHPLDVLGQDCSITHADGSQSTFPFPRQIAAENPFKNIQSMTWTRAEVPFELKFEGEIFETEDQRNWGDASFKTFCTPLDKPFPVELEKGASVFQRISFIPRRALNALSAKTAYILLKETAAAGKLPAIGIAASTEAAVLPEPVVPVLKALTFRHYRADVYPGRNNWVTEFSRDYENAYALGLPLEVVLHVSKAPGDELDAFVVVCQQNRVRLRKVLLLSANGLVTAQDVVNEIPRLKGVLPNVAFGAGTNYNFNELNKNRFQGGNADFISFSADPQEHAFDDLTILENAAALEHLVRSVQAIHGANKQVHLSPLTLRKRFNPYATNPADVNIEASRKADPRQKEVLAALWTFGCICSLTRGEASSLTFFQTIGNQGILSHDGEPYPVYDTLKQFTPFQGKPVKMLESADALAIQGMILDGKILALANLTQSTQRVRLSQLEVVLQPQEIKFEMLNRA